MAIGIRVKRAPKDYDLGASKFFGAPTIPVSWGDEFDEDEIFFCQIRLSDIAHLDPENRLPHTGYLYIFLHTEGGEYDLSADVRYLCGEPEMVVDDFNAEVLGYESFNDAYLMEFYECEDDADCIRLLGAPSDWNYESEPNELLLQYDPLDSDMGFLDFIDGFLYFFFRDDERNLDDAYLHEEFS